MKKSIVEKVPSTIRVTEDHQKRLTKIKATIFKKTGVQATPAQLIEKLLTAQETK